jgi:hypothetical protein
MITVGSGCWVWYPESEMDDQVSVAPRRLTIEWTGQPP